MAFDRRAILGDSLIIRMNLRFRQMDLIIVWSLATNIYI